MIPHLPFWTEDDEDNAIIIYNRYGIDIEKELFDAILEAEKEDAKKESRSEAIRRLSK